MSKKKKVQNRERPKDEVVQDKKMEALPEEEKTKVMDFGGIPERNLKKNLGCG